LTASERGELKAAVQQPPSAAGVAAATWSWKAVRQFIVQRFGKRLSPRSCLRYLHRLDFVWKRPKRLLLKADPAHRWGTAPAPWLRHAPTGNAPPS
jgi:transposase